MTECWCTEIAGIKLDIDHDLFIYTQSGLCFMLVSFVKQGCCGLYLLAWHHACPTTLVLEDPKISTLIVIDHANKCHWRKKHFSAHSSVVVHVLIFGVRVGWEEGVHTLYEYGGVCVQGSIRFKPNNSRNRRHHYYRFFLDYCCLSGRRRCRPNFAGTIIFSLAQYNIIYTRSTNQQQRQNIDLFAFLGVVCVWCNKQYKERWTKRAVVASNRGWVLIVWWWEWVVVVCCSGTEEVDFVPVVEEACDAGRIVMVQARCCCLLL